jgi:hypothetical protein
METPLPHLFIVPDLNGKLTQGMINEYSWVFLHWYTYDFSSTKNGLEDLLSDQKSL